MKFSTAVLLIFLPGCMSSPIDRAAEHGKEMIEIAAREAKEIVTVSVDRAGDRFESSAKVVVDHAGDRMDQSVDRFAVKTEAIVDRAADRADQTTANAAQETKDLLDWIKNWSVEVITLVGGAIIGLWQYRKASRFKRVAGIVVNAVESGGDVKEKVGDQIDGLKDRATIEQMIRNLKDIK